jgi:hypothetical protein
MSFDPQFVHPQISPSPSKKEDSRLIGRYGLVPLYSDVTGFEMNVILTYLQATGINPYARQALNMRQRYGTNF